jgi:hypothetical protein
MASVVFTMGLSFLGVWDTVDAVGLPFDGLAEALNRVFQWRFADRRVSRRVLRARQALSIDDERRTFLPNLWDEGPEQPTAPDTHPHVEQVGFAGVHQRRRRLRQGPAGYLSARLDAQRACREGCASPPTRGPHARR